MSQPPSPTRTPIRVPDADVDRIAAQLTHARLPATSVVQGTEHTWDYGTSLTQLRRLVADWRDGSAAGADGSVCGQGRGQGFKSWWRSVEDRLNQYDHFSIELEGVKLHYVHALSADADAIPLVFSHGWPGSFYEAYPLIPELIEKDPVTGIAFHVVVPSLPGYGFSNGGALPRGWGGQDHARIIVQLMTTVLGYPSFAAQGGDWGALISRFLANHAACRIIQCVVGRCALRQLLTAASQHQLSAASATATARAARCRKSASRRSGLVQGSYFMDARLCAARPAAQPRLRDYGLRLRGPPAH